MYRPAYDETEDIKKNVNKIVATYDRREMEIERDRKIRDSWCDDFPDTRSELPSAFLEQSIADAETGNGASFS